MKGKDGSLIWGDLLIAEGVVVRNLALEKIAENVLFPCKYNCGERVYWIMKEEHEEKCRLKKYSCPLPQCLFEGPCDAICVHFKIDHGIHCEFDGESCISLSNIMYFYMHVLEVLY